MNIGLESTQLWMVLVKWDFECFQSLSNKMKRIRITSEPNPNLKGVSEGMVVFSAYLKAGIGPYLGTMSCTKAKVQET